MAVNPKKSNRQHQRKWYAQQRRSDGGCIYIVTNIFTGEEYVGKTKNSLQKRWWQHVAAANAGKGRVLGEDIRRFGKEMFTIQEVEACPLGEDLAELESRIVKEYNSKYN